MVLMWFVLLSALVQGANHAPPYDHIWCWETKVCSADADCKQPNGESGHCCLGKCRQFPLSRGDVCSGLPAGCPSCDSNLNCVAFGTSGQKVCQQQALTNGCSCTNTSAKNCLSGQPCLPSGLCGPDGVAPNGRCEVDSQCITPSKCNGTHCQYIADTDPCGSSNGVVKLCNPGSICASSSKCAPLSQYKGTCNNVDYECAQPNLYCGANKQCANRTVIGGNCSASACVVDGLCNNGVCVASRNVADNAACTRDDACVSGICAGSKCTPTHFAAAGAACVADLDCPFGASCQNKLCTPSGLDAPCDPTLGGSDMDKQCQGSKDLYCSCSSLCVATDAAILPTGTATSDCERAKLAISKLAKSGDLRKIDPSSLTDDQRRSLATDQCCKNCNKDARVSAVGYLVDCAAKTISVPSSADACDTFAVDPLALSGCPSRSTSDASALKPIFAMSMLVLCVLM